jgi:hypothetical protein
MSHPTDYQSRRQKRLHMPSVAKAQAKAFIATAANWQTETLRSYCKKCYGPMGLQDEDLNFLIEQRFNR